MEEALEMIKDAITTFAIHKVTKRTLQPIPLEYPIGIFDNDADKAYYRIDENNHGPCIAPFQG